MNCSDADLLMMKYMDGEISKDEAEKLNEHLHSCLECKESFTIYDSMIMTISDWPEVTAPEGFELSVMTQIKALGNNKYEAQVRIWDKVSGAVWGTFAVLFSAGAVLVVYREPIINSLSYNPYFGEYVKRIAPLAKKVGEQGEALQGAVDSAVSYTSTVFSNSVGILLGIVAVACALQVYLLHRRKRVNKADDR